MKEKIAKLFVKLANKLSKEDNFVSNVFYRNFYNDVCHIKKYDIDKFEFVTVQYETPTQTLEEAKKYGIDLYDDIKHKLTGEMAKQIISRHKDDIQVYPTYIGNDLSGKTQFVLKLLVEKPKEKNDTRRN